MITKKSIEYEVLRYLYSMKIQICLLYDTINIELFINLNLIGNKREVLKFNYRFYFIKQDLILKPPSSIKCIKVGVTEFKVL